MCRKLFWLVSLVLVLAAVGTTYGARQVVWVSFHATDAAGAGAAGVSFVDAPDKGYTDLLKANGYEVVRYLQTGNPDVNMLNAADLVIISRSVASTSFQGAAATNWNTKITAPLIDLNAWTVRKSRLGFVTASNNPADASGNFKLVATDPNNPVFKGVALDANGVMVNEFGGGTQTYPDGTVSLGTSISTDPVDPNGTVLAKVPAGTTTAPANAAIIIEWKAGATLTHDGGAGKDVLAGRRMVLYTCTRENQSKTGNGEAGGQYNLTADGAQVFLNAVAYMMKPAKVVWVSFHATDAAGAGAAGVSFVDAPDKGYTDLLKANGYEVVRYLQTGNPDVNMLNAADLVIISRSVASTSFQGAAATNWNTKITAPVINLNAWTARKSRLGFVTASNNPADASGNFKLVATDPNHPVFKGVVLDANSVMVNDVGGGTQTYPDGTVSLGTSISTDPVDPNGIVLAKVPAGTTTAPVNAAIITEWLGGVTLTHDGGAGRDVLAGRRMVFYTCTRENQGKTGNGEAGGQYNLAPDGAEMFLNAVAYMIAPL